MTVMSNTDRHGVTLFLCGDVMTGRGIDQILPTPVEPRLFEPWVKSAVEYVELAERVSGPIPRDVAFEYVWGCALAQLDRYRSDVRIVNLETAVTTSTEWDPHKEIHYRMHPANVSCLTAAAIDCCVLANNHVLDWGPRGLRETLQALHAVGLRTAGAGTNEEEAAAPAVIELSGNRVLVYGFALPSSGVSRAWKASGRQGGVNWLATLSGSEVDTIARLIRRERRPGDLVIASIHWGGNWGYRVARREREFAHGLIDTAGVDLVHGHSSHHPRAIEVYQHKAILYGCGDLLNDYEGIGGHESFRPELVLLYFPQLNAADGHLLGMTMIPMRVRQFRLCEVGADEIAWLAQTMERECRKLGSQVLRQRDGLTLRWAS